MPAQIARKEDTLNLKCGRVPSDHPLLAHSHSLKVESTLGARVSRSGPPSPRPPSPSALTAQGEGGALREYDRTLGEWPWGSGFRDQGTGTTRPAITSLPHSSASVAGRLSDSVASWLSGSITQPPNHPTTQSPNCLVAQLPNCPVAPSPRRPAVRISCDRFREPSGLRRCV